MKRVISTILIILGLITTIIFVASPALSHHRDSHGKGKTSTPTVSPTPTSTTTQTPTQTIAPGTIDGTYFGNHVLGPLEQNLDGTGNPTVWPYWNPNTIRLWNAWGYNPNKGKYEGISWNNINTANGVYDWYLFDKLLLKYKASGVTDFIYTFGYIPQWAGGGTTYDKPPTSYTYLYNFARAVAQRSVAIGVPIKNFEVWNEPNNGTGTWTGTTPQMVEMTKAIRNGVKSVNSTANVLSPSPQGNSTVWMSGYLAAGGGAYVDTMAFHGYTYNTPETFLQQVRNYKTLFANYGLSTKPVWDTEAMDLRTSDKTLQARFLAIYYLLHKGEGVDRFYWYAYDADLGRQWNYNTGTNAAGIANAEVQKWILGGTLSKVVQNGTVYTVTITKNGIASHAVWNSAGASSYSTTHTKFATIQGATGSIVGGSITIGQTPMLLTN